MPEGWAWEFEPIDERHVEGAFCKATDTFVWIEEGEFPLIHMRGTGGARPVVFTMVFNRWNWERRGDSV